VLEVLKFPAFTEHGSTSQTPRMSLTLQIISIADGTVNVTRTGIPFLLDKFWRISPFLCPDLRLPLQFRCISSLKSLSPLQCNAVLVLKQAPRHEDVLLSGGINPCILNLGTRRWWVSASCPGRFSIVVVFPGTHLISGRVDPRAGLAKRKYQIVATAGSWTSVLKIVA
jgi:hypothetical protein